MATSASKTDWIAATYEKRDREEREFSREKTKSNTIYIQPCHAVHCMRCQPCQEPTELFIGAMQLRAMLGVHHRLR